MKEFWMVCYNSEIGEFLERIIIAPSAADAFSEWADYLLYDKKYFLSEHCTLSIKCSGELGMLHC